MSRWFPNEKRRKEISEAQRAHDIATNKDLRKKSGKVNDTDPLVTFLYVLMRDELPTGRVEDLMRQATLIIKGDGDVAFSNGFLARYAQHLAKRLRP